jgi:uncharacterized Tic20 family protein
VIPPGYPAAGPGGGPAVPAQQVPHRPQRNGTLPWALGFLVYVPIPVLAHIVTSIVQLCVGLAQRKYGGLAARNGVRAANWGLTKLVLLLAWIVAMILVDTLLDWPAQDRYRSTADSTAHDGVLALLGFALFAFGILVLVYTIVGTVRAAKGRDVGLVLIPFIRTPQDADPSTSRSSASGIPPAGSGLPPAAPGFPSASNSIPPSNGSNEQNSPDGPHPSGQNPPQL